MATLAPAKTPASDVKTATNFITGYDVNQGGKQVYVSPGYTPGVSATPIPPKNDLPPATTVPGLNTAPTVTSDSSNIRSNANDLGNKIDNLGIGGNDAGTSGNQPPKAPDLSSNTSDELKAIEDAGVSAGRQYDTLIKQAETEKGKGMATSTIGAGEAGGFMSTQFAGLSALQKTQGGDFVGVGGKLEEIKSSYDLNISDLQAKKLTAIENAKQSYKDYLRTGKQQDYDNAMKSYTAAEQHTKDINQMNIDKANLMLNVAKNAREDKTAVTQQAKDAAPGLVGKTPDEIAQYAADNKLDPTILQGQVYQANLDLQEKNTLNDQKNLDMIAKTVSGGTVTIDGKQYKVSGATPDAPKTVDTGTKLYQQVYDAKTGKWSLQDTGIASHNLTAQQSLGVLEKIAEMTTKPNWSADPSQVAMVNMLGKAYEEMSGQKFSPISVSSNGVNGGNAGELIGNKYPSGTKGGECVIFARNIVPDLPTGLITYADKQAKANVSKSDLIKDPQVGDALVIDTGQPAGHIAVVNAILGNGMVQVSESNWDLKGTINNSRTVNLYDKSVYGAYRGQMAEDFTGGMVMTSPPPTASWNKTDSRTGLTLGREWDAATNYLKKGGSIQSFVGSMFGGTPASKSQKAAATNMIENTSAAIAKNMNMDSAQVQQMYKNNGKAAGDIVNRSARIETVTQTLASQFPRLMDLADKVKTMGITESDIQAGAATAQSKFGSPDAASYIELLTTMRGDYAAMQSALAGSRGGLMFVEDAKKAIPAGMTSEQYKSMQDTIEKSAANAVTATNAEAQKLYNFDGYNDLNANLQKVDEFAKTKVGSDGKLSPQDYQFLKGKWGNPSEFDQYFSYLKNPNNPNY